MTQDPQVDKIQVLKLTLHQRLVGYLAGFENGRNVLTFADEFTSDPQRPTFSLITHPEFVNSKTLMATAWSKHHRLHPTLANLLPEGALRTLIAQGLKTHIDNEFQIFSYLGGDLPGALVATPMAPQDVPDRILTTHGQAQAVTFGLESQQNKFSLAGVQMKFSMKEQDGRYNLSSTGELGDWIIKTPSTQHQSVPLNEYTAMTLAAMAGVDIPEIKLIALDKLDNLPAINLPDEQLAFAIKRFDRNGNTRIHIEDFAQVLVKYPQSKYNGGSYEQIARILHHFSGDGIADAQQFARRLLVNVLLANGDAHLKNWSLWYPNSITPRLSPAYDIVTTAVYFDQERQYALNMARTKEWFTITNAHFEAWAKKSGIPWRVIQSHLQDTLERARTLWPKALESLPMDEMHKQRLKRHWQLIQPEFRIES
ncbi:MAG: serine/threonine-protein kinase HipA [Phenylobacterium sp.]|jgi:serine/threonine-protein kinase HipA